MITQHLRAFFKDRPEKKALICEDRHLTYAELEESVASCSLAFEQLGITQGSRIALLINNSLEFIICMLAAAHRAAIVVPLNTSLKEESLKKAFEATDCEFVVGGLAQLKKLDHVKLSTPSRSLSIDKSEAGFQAINFKSRKSLADIEVDPQAPFIISMTSGSTGDPKPIVFSQETKFLRAMSARDCYRLNDSIVSVAATPLYHSLAMRLALLPLFLGGTSVVMRRFTPSLWLESVEKFKISFSILVSAQLKNILSEYKQKAYDLKSLKTLVSSSAAISQELKAELCESFDCEIHEIYGASELGVVSNLSAFDSHDKLGSVGKALPGVEIRILDAKDGVGEIAVKSNMIFSGYYKKDNSLADGFFRTGDLGRLDDDGFLYFCGRIKEIIITGGINVYPTDIEKVLNESPLVKECAAVGIKDSHFGEAVLAVVVPNDPDSFSLKDLQRHCAKNLADYQQPLGFETVDSLPRNEMGKVVKTQLQERFADLDLSEKLRKIIQPSG